MADLLVVEDDRTIGASLLSGLLAGGFDVVWTPTGSEALESAAARTPDLVVLDLGLPDVDGFDLCRTLRAALPQAVIVILTARQDEMDVVTGLEAGADDFLIKPFRLAELLARVRAHLRRATASTGASPPIRIGPLQIELSSRMAHAWGVDLPLRAKEFDLLARLAREPGVVVSREDLMSDVWDENWFGSTKTLDVHVAALRHKLLDLSDVRPEAGAGLPTITTLRGRGYRLDPAKG